MPDTTPELLDELERLEKAAATGPVRAEWDESTPGAFPRQEVFRIVTQGAYDERRKQGTSCRPRYEATVYTTAEAEFLVALRNAAPALLSTARLASARLAEVRRLREVLPKLRRGHDSDCGVREDDGYVRCTCGAIATNALIDAALSGGEGEGR